MKKVSGLLVGFLLLLAGCGANSDGLTSVDLILDYTPNTNHTGIYVAEKLGYYADAGLDVNIIQPSETATESLVSKNQAEFGISVGENVAAFNEDSPQKLTSIYSLYPHNYSGFASVTDKNIKTPKDFENKTYCGWGSNVESAIIDALMKSVGADPSTVKFKTSDLGFEALSSTECDFMWVYEGWDLVNMEQKGIDYNYVPLLDYNLDWYTPVIVTSEDYLNKNPEIVKSFLEATKKGYQYAIENPKESADIFLEANPEFDKDFIYASQDKVSTTYSKDGYQDPEVWKSFIQFLIDHEIISADNDPESYYKNILPKEE